MYIECILSVYECIFKSVGGPSEKTTTRVYVECIQSVYRVYFECILECILSVY